MSSVSISVNKIVKRSKLPDWIRVRAPISSEFQEVRRLSEGLKLHTVCQSAACPNIAECWQKRHATFMIMGDICTRSCRFCNIKTGRPLPLDRDEPMNVATAVKQLELRHVVITSVDRDDLTDGGADHFVNTINAIRSLNPVTTIEILTPDFLNKEGAIEKIVAAKPDVFNHNIETVRRLFTGIKLRANFDHSLWLLKRVKELDKTIFTKSGIIAGMGETNDEIYEAMDELRHHDVEFLTIGQYLRPNHESPRYINVDRFVTPEEFQDFETVAYQKGFLMVSSSPLTRSSYHADELFRQLKQKH